MTKHQDDAEFFKLSGKALGLWARKYNTAEIADILKIPEHCVERWIWYWREFSRS